MTAPDGQGSLFDDDPSFSESEHTEEQSQQTISHTVVQNIQKKKRNDSLCDDVEVVTIHHHPENTRCDCCQEQMIEIGSTIVCDGYSAYDKIEGVTFANC